MSLLVATYDLSGMIRAVITAACQNLLERCAQRFWDRSGRGRN